MGIKVEWNTTDVCSRGIVRLKNVRTTGRRNHLSFIGLLRQAVYDRSLFITRILLRLKDDHHGPSVVSPTNDLTTPNMIKNMSCFSWIKSRQWALFSFNAAPSHLTIHG